MQPFGSASFGKLRIFRNSFLYQKHYNVTLCRGKPWHNSVLSSTRPGIINIQSGSDNTGAEANINHGFSTTEVLADILVSITQIKCNTLLNVHHIPGEKNTLADDLSRGKLSSFSEDSRLCTVPRFPGTLIHWSNGALM